MELRELGRTGFFVTPLCLGTMTWGEQNTEAEAFAQLDHATGEGINFGIIGRFDARWIHINLTRVFIVLDDNAVQTQQAGDNLNVPDFRDVANH